MTRRDLHVKHVPNPLLAPAPSIVERVFFSRIGHTFGPAPLHPHEPAAYLVQDFLLDQSNMSGADGEMHATKSFDLTTATSYRFELAPKDLAKRVTVKAPQGSQARLVADIGRRYINASTDIGWLPRADVHLIDLTGPYHW